MSVRRSGPAAPRPQAAVRRGHPAGPSGLRGGPAAPPALTPLHATQAACCSFQGIEARLRAIAPRFGWIEGRFELGRCWGRSGGASWAPHPLPAGDLPPVLFAIGELDNNTNYLGQLHVAEQIPSARVLWHGDSHLTKTYGSTCAVSDLSFHVKPGQVTGFLGHNGSGKSTTMRMILGLHRPDSGRALINGVPKRDLPHPMREVGAMLDAAEVQ
ncbi:MAG TPA: ATP-binding cassette domain-containing protein, partial [Ornithinicoccus sp.]|nr:ATP-binding cassette domain-containing protein [Ornithinicoccus sp.]